MIFISQIIDIFEDQKNNSEEKIMQKLNDIDQNHKYNEQCLFEYLDFFYLFAHFVLVTNEKKC